MNEIHRSDLEKLVQSSSPIPRVASIAKSSWCLISKSEWSGSSFCWSVSIMFVRFRFLTRLDFVANRFVVFVDRFVSFPASFCFISSRNSSSVILTPDVLFNLDPLDVVVVFVVGCCWCSANRDPKTCRTASMEWIVWILPLVPRLSPREKDDFLVENG